MYRRYIPVYTKLGVLEYWVPIAVTYAVLQCIRSCPGVFKVIPLIYMIPLPLSAILTSTVQVQYNTSSPHTELSYTGGIQYRYGTSIYLYRNSLYLPVLSTHTYEYTGILHRYRYRYAYGTSIAIQLQGIFSPSLPPYCTLLVCTYPRMYGAFRYCQ